MVLKRKKMFPLTKKELKSHQNAVECYICREIFIRKFAKYKNHCKVTEHYHYTGKYRGAAHSMCNLKYIVPKEIPAIFHKRSIYNYHVILKELANESMMSL